MTADQWGNRIKAIVRAETNGDPEPFILLCLELEVLSTPKPADPVPVQQLAAKPTQPLAALLNPVLKKFRSDTDIAEDSR